MGDKFDPKKLMGVTMLDVVSRANTFVAEVMSLDPREVVVPVVGGHAGVKPPCSFTQKEIEYLTDHIQNGGTEVVEMLGSRVCLRGDANIVECAFVATHVLSF
ncbi:unnamed protein product [Brassica napus]|uniref:(rape) hypothetical protein n=1 Tax=Brassica napus TaxID=3708 RepID=A0A816IQ55_BRANA|nr:unnamed protein product [Brassica napus]